MNELIVEQIESILDRYPRWELAERILQIPEIAQALSIKHTVEGWVAMYGTIEVIEKNE